MINYLPGDVTAKESKGSLLKIESQATILQE